MSDHDKKVMGGLSEKEIMIINDEEPTSEDDEEEEEEVISGTERRERLEKLKAEI